MQAPCCSLLLYLVLLSGAWANLKGKWDPWLMHIYLHGTPQGCPSSPPSLLLLVPGSTPPPQQEWLSQVGSGDGNWGCKGCKGLMGDLWIPATSRIHPSAPTLSSALFSVPSPPCQPLSHVGTFTIRLLQTTTFQNTSFVETEGLGLLEDIELGFLDKHTRSIHFCQPWVHPALPYADWDTIDNLLKIYLQQFHHLINEKAAQKDVPYPFVVQCIAGCVLYPNRTSQAFAYVGYNGEDFLSFNTENITWTLSQDTKLSRYVQSFLQNYTALSELVEIVFNDTCVDDMEVLLQYGRAAVERQELPVATVFGRTPSPAQLLLVCHVTGFYPRPISVAWLRDGQEVPPGPALNTSSILPNADLTYQLRSVLAVTPRDGHSYACRVRHRSLGTRSLLIPWENGSPAPTISIAIAVLLLVATASAGGFWWWKRRKGNEVAWDTQEFII
ncbi:LOW QUALITY PROTEIN: antigen-presenting glycoprotein CD1d-like [Parus major]|uniref:LOW QUALITY PROTEIN: antigen-presenting glycoprotein CD1d-like n=1 Tax=Parus major TaxID=9157 RepID=UPI001443C54E|nr:LOW QUALITY PROTEIN: antigen-presenting glycoprotein CD1d-like [Parus major]